MTHATDMRGALQALFADGYGRAMSVSQTTPGAFDPTTLKAGSGSTVSITGIGRLGTYSDYLLAGGLIRSSDRKCTFVPDDVTALINANDMLVDGADSYSVISAQKRELNSVICWALQVRR